MVSDGYVFIFVTISHEGVVRLSRRFDVLGDDTRVVLGCFKYLLEKTSNMSPNLSPDRNDGRQQQGANNIADEVDETGGADSPIDVDDDEFINPPEEED